MKIFFRLVIFMCILSTSLISCGDRANIKRAMSEFIDTEIIIPGDLDCIYNRQLSKINKDTLKSLQFVVYCDSLECSACRISHISDLYPLYDMADTSSFSVIMVFSPKLSEVSDVQNQLKIANHPIPIYIDVNRTFSQLNKSIPSDHRFHYFLLNENNRPEFVGNPLSSTQLFTLFSERITN